MTAPDVELARVWHRVAGRSHDDVLARLLARHREPHRRYHTATHVLWVCRHVGELAAVQPVRDLDAVLAAALFHDAVYDPHRTTNEADSARLAQHELLEVGWSTDRTAEVSRLIQLTAAHAAPDDDVDAAVLVDADLAILGADPAAYQAYVTGVRQEYAHVDDHGWHSGRSAVLHSLLDRPTLYATATMRATREHRARANITAELAALAR